MRNFSQTRIQIEIEKWNQKAAYLWTSASCISLYFYLSESLICAQSEPAFLAASDIFIGSFEPAESVMSCFMMAPAKKM